MTKKRTFQCLYNVKKTVNQGKPSETPIIAGKVMKDGLI